VAEHTSTPKDENDDIPKQAPPHEPQEEKASDAPEGNDQLNESAPVSESPKPSTDPELKEAMASAPAPATNTPAAVKPKSKLSRKKLIIISSIAAAAVLIAVLFVVPLTRYAILGTFIKREANFTLLDSKTNKPVSDVQITIGGKSAKTDAQGKATVYGLPVGSKTAAAKKKYYQDLSTTVLVSVTGSGNNYQLQVVATGRQVPIKVINKVSKQPVEKAQVSAEDTTSTTDKNGEAVIVLPADVPTVKATISGDGYNKQQAIVQVTEQKDDRNTFALAPSGTVYFLSKRSGKIDVMKSDLDGSNAQTVLAGTGREEDGATVLLASRDWKYLALKARRDSDKPKLYLIDRTKNDKLSTMDEGNATFTLSGWYNDTFIYQVSRDDLKNWQPKQAAIKSFNVTSGEVKNLDETDAVGTNSNDFGREYFGSVYILDNQITYAKNWSTGYYLPEVIASKKSTLNSVKPDGSDKKVIKDVPGNNNIFLSAVLYKPQELYVRLAANGTNTYYEYENGQLTQHDELKDKFDDPYPTYLLSPSGKNTFWSEPRDGKNTLFVGDASGENGKELVSLSEFTPYGWYGEDYLFVSKGGSELYLLSRVNPTAGPLKVTDYHKPQASFSGYGYGYGGF